MISHYSEASGEVGYFQNINLSQVEKILHFLSKKYDKNRILYYKKCLIHQDIFSIFIDFISCLCPKGGGEGFYDKLGAEVGTENPINGALATFIDRLSWFLVCRLSFTGTTPKIGYFGDWSASFPSL